MLIDDNHIYIKRVNMIICILSKQLKNAVFIFFWSRKILKSVLNRILLLLSERRTLLEFCFSPK